MKKAERKSREDLGPGHPCRPPVDLAEPLPGPKKETVPIFWPPPNSQVFNEVSHMMAVGLGPREIAEVLNVAYDKFCPWYLSGSIRTHLTLSRTAEIEKKRREAEEKEELEKRQNKIMEKFRC